MQYVICRWNVYEVLGSTLVRDKVHCDICGIRRLSADFLVAEYPIENTSQKQLYNYGSGNIRIELDSALFSDFSKKMPIQPNLGWLYSVTYFLIFLHTVF